MSCDGGLDIYLLSIICTVPLLVRNRKDVSLCLQLISDLCHQIELDTTNLKLDQLKYPSVFCSIALF